MQSIPESDWKVFKRVHKAAVDRFCSRILEEVRELVSTPRNDPHERYLQLFKLINQRNEEIADAFDDYRRSTALFQIAKMQQLGVVTDEEFRQFSEETRNSLIGLRWIEEH
jgi:hypothetical protein